MARTAAKSKETRLKIALERARVAREKRRYWIKRYVFECPPCGASDLHLERVYDETKPADPSKRVVFGYLAGCSCLA